MSIDLSKSQPWRVMLVDDSLVFLNVTQQYLEKFPNLEVVATADSADEVIAVALQKNPQVILLDLEMPGKTGLEIIPDLKTSLPDCKIIILSLMESANYKRICQKGGADSFVEKEQMLTRLIPEIHNVMQN